MEPDHAVVDTLDRLCSSAYAVTKCETDYDDEGNPAGTRTEIDTERFEEWTTSALHLLEAVFAGTVHHRRFQECYNPTYPSVNDFRCLKGIMEAARKDFSAGMLFRIRALAAAEVFVDFLTMAEHLLDQGYKDAAAVLIGAVLEQQLRKLCVARNVPIEDTDANSAAHARKAERLNAELASAGAYSKGDQKMITACLDLRNNAAHGNYSAYIDTQVQVMLNGVSDFVRRNPA